MEKILPLDTYFSQEDRETFYEDDIDTIEPISEGYTGRIGCHPDYYNFYSEDRKKHIVDEIIRDGNLYE